jgi:hypothetical protein
MIVLARLLRRLATGREEINCYIMRSLDRQTFTVCNNLVNLQICPVHTGGPGILYT